MKANHFFKLATFLLLFAFLGCQKEDIIVLEEATAQENTIQIFENTFQEFSTSSEFIDIYTKYTQIEAELAKTVSTAKDDDLYNFTIDSSNIKQVIVGNIISYTLPIKRAESSSLYFENLLIQQDNLKKDSIFAFLIKHTHNGTLKAVSEHSSFTMEGSYTIHPLNTKKLGLTANGCGSEPQAWCSYGTQDHVAGARCHIYNPDKIYLKAVPLDCGITEGGGSRPTGGGGVPTSPQQPIISPTLPDGTVVDFWVGAVNSLSRTLGITDLTQINFLLDNTIVVQQIETFLLGVDTAQNRAFAKDGIYFLIENPQFNFSQFLNWFSRDYPEIKSNSVEIIPSNITYDQPLTQQALPSLTSFISNFPKLGSSGNYSEMPTSQVYQLVGGSLLNSHLNNPSSYSNACSIRGSRALIYSGINIPVLNYPNVGQRTQKGGDNKNYILDAVSFNKFMLDKFGEASFTLEGNDANDVSQVTNLLSGKNGIYVIINNNHSQAGYSGHVDAIINGICISNAYVNPTGGVKSIRIWVLN